MELEIDNMYNNGNQIQEGVYRQTEHRPDSGSGSEYYVSSFIY